MRNVRNAKHVPTDRDRRTNERATLRVSFARVADHLADIGARRVCVRVRDPVYCRRITLQTFPSLH